MARTKKTPQPGTVVTIQKAHRVSLRRKLLKNGQWSLFLDVNRPNGKRSYESLDIRLSGDKEADREALTEGRSALTQMEIALRDERHGKVNREVSKVRLLDYAEKVASTKNTQTQYRALVHMLRNYETNDVTMAQVNYDWLDGFKAHLRSRGLGANTIASYWANLKTIMRTAVRAGVIPSNPMDQIDAPRKTPTMRRFLSAEEIMKLAATPMKHDAIRRAFFFSCFTGLRWSDVSTLTWDAISEGRMRYRARKTGKESRVKLSEDALDMLGERGADHDLVFKLPGLNHVNRMLEIWALKAGIERITFHASRHTFGTQTYIHTGDIYVTSTLMQHSSAAQTKPYAHMVDAKLDAAIDSLPRLNINGNASNEAAATK